MSAPSNTSWDDEPTFVDILPYKGEDVVVQVIDIPPIKCGRTDTRPYIHPPVTLVISEPARLS